MAGEAELGPTQDLAFLKAFLAEGAALPGVGAAELEAVQAAVAAAVAFEVSCPRPTMWTHTCTWIRLRGLSSRPSRWPR